MSHIQPSHIKIETPSWIYILLLAIGACVAGWIWLIVDIARNGI